MLQLEQTEVEAVIEEWAESVSELTKLANMLAEASGQQFKLFNLLLERVRELEGTVADLSKKVGK